MFVLIELRDEPEVPRKPLTVRCQRSRWTTVENRERASKPAKSDAVLPVHPSKPCGPSGDVPARAGLKIGLMDENIIWSPFHGESNWFSRNGVLREPAINPRPEITRFRLKRQRRAGLMQPKWSKS